MPALFGFPVEHQSADHSHAAKVHPLEETPNNSIGIGMPNLGNLDVIRSVAQAAAHGHHLVGDTSGGDVCRCM